MRASRCSGGNKRTRCRLVLSTALEKLKGSAYESRLHGALEAGLLRLRCRYACTAGQKPQDRLVLINRVLTDHRLFISAFMTATKVISDDMYLQLVLGDCRAEYVPVESPIRWSESFAIAWIGS